MNPPSQMKLIGLLAWLVGFALALSTVSPEELQLQTTEVPPILSYVNENHHNGTYKFSYVTSNNISMEQEGYVRHVAKNKTVYAARGTYSYVDPYGKLITVTWYADDTGFHAFGDNIPSEQPVLAQRPGFAPEFWRG